MSTPHRKHGNKKIRNVQRFFPIPDNRSDVTPQKLSAPVRDLADLLAQIAAEKIINSTPEHPPEG